jgi:hypothetical protein
MQGFGAKMAIAIGRIFSPNRPNQANDGFYHKGDDMNQKEDDRKYNMTYTKILFVSRYKVVIYFDHAKPVEVYSRCGLALENALEMLEELCTILNAA